MLKNQDGTTKNNFSLGLESNKTILIPDRVNKKLTMADEFGFRWIVGESPILISGSFDGVTPPTPGDASGEYFLCHTSIGNYTAGGVYYDNTTEIQRVLISHGCSITTKDAIASAFIDLEADTLYSAESDIAPYAWTAKGGGGGGGGEGTAITNEEHTATAEQSVFTVAYTVGLMDMLRNGIELGSADFTATNGTSVTLVAPAALDDLIVFKKYEPFAVANTYTKAETDALIGDPYTQAETDTLLDAKLADIVDDTTPQLGGNLDCNGKAITGSSYIQAADASLGSGTHTFNRALGDHQQLTITGDTVTIAFSNFVTGKANGMIIDLVNAGAWTPVFPAGAFWGGKTLAGFTEAGIDRIVVWKDKDEVFCFHVSDLDIGVVA